MLTLTERTIREAKPDGRTRILWDGSVTGFGVKGECGRVEALRDRLPHRGPAAAGDHRPGC